MTIHSISIIGTGNVAWHLGNAFAGAGVEIKHIAGRDLEKTRQLSELLHSKTYGHIDQEMPDADLFMLAVKDDVIRTVAEKVFKPGRLLIHNAGAINGNILQFNNNNFGVLWPLQTLTKNNVIDLKQTLIAVSGNSPEVQSALKELASKISNKIVEVNEDQRAIMHLSAVWINNYTNHMIDIAYNLLRENDLQMDMFFPLMEEHLDKLKQMPPDQLQTGPAIRGDLATLVKHKQLLQGHPEWQLLYDTLAKSILHKYLKK